MEPEIGAQLIDGVALAATLRQQLRAEIASDPAARRPGMAVLLVGNDAASIVYVRNKVRACDEVGIVAFAERLPADATEDQVPASVRRFNEDPSVNGILVQPPLPRHIDSPRILAAVSPDKDVDGFGLESQGTLLGGLPGLRPCTPAGVMHMLQGSGVALQGARAALLGRSYIGGNPEVTIHKKIVRAEK